MSCFTHTRRYATVMATIRHIIEDAIAVIQPPPLRDCHTHAITPAAATLIGFIFAIAPLRYIIYYFTLAIIDGIVAYRQPPRCCRCHYATSLLFLLMPSISPRLPLAAFAAFFFRSARCEAAAWLLPLPALIQRALLCYWLPPYIRL